MRKSANLPAAELALGDVLEALPGMVFVADLTALQVALASLRAAGVTDIATHLDQHPEVAAELRARIRVLAANAAALQEIGAHTSADVRTDNVPPAQASWRDLLHAYIAAAWSPETPFRGEGTFDAGAGREKLHELRCSVRHRAGLPDWRHVVLTCTESPIPTAHVPVHRETNDVEDQLFERANLLLWRATVRRRDGEFQWSFHLSFHARASRLFHLTSTNQRGHLWEEANTPDLAAMRECSSAALEQGKPGYHQEFRILTAGRTAWLAEEVAIQPVGPDEWRLIGVVSDITARREAEETNRRSVAHLRNLLERADCMLWQARVQEQAGTYLWDLDVPRSGLQRRIFGERGEFSYANVTGGGGASLFGAHRIPEAREKDARGEAALRSGAAGYRNEFRLITPEQTFWLEEQVTITPLGPGQFDLVGVIFDITDRRQMDDERRRSAAQVRQILERADCMLWQAEVRDENGGLRWKFDLPASGLQRRLFRGTVPPDLGGLSGTNDSSLYGGNRVLEQQEIDECSRRALRGGAPGYEQEFRIQGPDQLYWMHEQVSITAVGPGQWDLVGVVFDVTARRRAEEARRATEQRLQQLLTRADCMIWEARVRHVAGAQFEWLFYTPDSQLYRSLFGHNPAEAQPQMWSQLNVPDIGNLHVRSSDALLSGKSAYAQEFQVLGPQQMHWLREQVTINPVAAGVWDLVGVVTDITPRRAAEAALETEKERLAVTLRAMSEGVVTTDRHGIVQFTNRAAEEFLGCTAGGAVGRALADVCDFMDTRSGQPYHLPLREVFSAGAMLHLPPQTTLRQPGGRAVMVAGQCVPLRDASSTITGAVLVLADITERQRLDEHLQRASKLESIGILAGGIAHDFNNILTAVMGNLSLALLDLPPEKPLHQHLVDAQAATLRARDLTQQLLTFAKGGDPVRAVLPLPQIITEVARFALHGSPVGCEFQLPEDLWSADADKGQFAQIVQNLVINAMQAMAAGGLLRIGAANTTVALDSPVPLPAGDYVHLTVADTGSGIRPEDIRRIFDPYFTTKQHGHGLGLATVYSIVRRHGGHIDVESALGRGTIFHIWLPAARGVTAAPAPSPPAATVAQLRGRVLFMDDEAPIRKLGATLISRLGLDVEVAADGEEAVRRFQAARDAGRSFDVVVMDLTVPGGMGGRETLDELRKLDPTVRAIVSSGYSSDPVLANHRAYGFCAVVAKPYHVEHFARVLREALHPGAVPSPATAGTTVDALTRREG